MIVVNNLWCIYGYIDRANVITSKQLRWNLDLVIVILCEQKLGYCGSRKANHQFGMSHPVTYIHDINADQRTQLTRLCQLRYKAKHEGIRIFENQTWQRWFSMGF